jgi:hypothetical protein
VRLKPLEQKSKDMEFIKSLMTSENAVMLGVSLTFVGIIYYFSPRILGGHFEACNQARQTLKQEALQLGQDERYKRLTAEEKGISRIPMYSKALMAAGLGIVVMALIWGILK